MNKADIDWVEAKVFNRALSEIGWTDGSYYWSPSIQGPQTNPKQGNRYVFIYGLA